jgi:hypothetical protein
VLYVDGVIFAILLINLINPLVDKIRPKAMERWRNMGEMIKMVVVLTILSIISGGGLAA